MNRREFRLLTVGDRDGICTSGSAVEKSNFADNLIRAYLGDFDVPFINGLSNGNSTDLYEVETTRVRPFPEKGLSSAVGRRFDAHGFQGDTGGFVLAR